MLTDSVDRSAVLEQLSALADGELDGPAVAAACGVWRGDEAVRASWHTYQLIGDVLRSDDLGCDPAHDAGFLAALRARLAEEPVVLAPRALLRAAGAGEVDPVVGRGRRWAWMAPSAVAAGFVAVAGFTFLSRAPEAPSPAGGAASMAKAAQASNGFETASALAPSSRNALAADPQALVASGKLIRDIRLDRYLSAHKEFAGSSALGVPSGFLRNATAEAADR